MKGYKYFNTCPALYRDGLKMIAQGVHPESIEKTFRESLYKVDDQHIFYTVSKHFSDYKATDSSFRDSAVLVIAEAVCEDICSNHNLEFTPFLLNVTESYTRVSTEDTSLKEKKQMSLEDMERLAKQDADDGCVACKI